MTARLFQYKWAIISLVVFGLGYAGFSLVGMHREMAGLNMGSLAGGPVWFVTSVEFDVLRLENALYRYSEDRYGADDVHQTFDILWSRLAQLEVGNTHDKLLEYDIDMTVYERSMDVLIAYDDRVTSPDFGVDEAQELFALFDQINGELRMSSLKVLEASIAETNDLRLRALSLAKTALFASLTIAGMSILLLIVFRLDSILTRRILFEKEALLQEAYAADIAKSQFIAVINHELRTPLTSISASLALLKSGSLPQMSGTAGDLIGIAERNCIALKKIVDDLLDIERFASGKMEFDFQEINFSDALIQAIEDSKSYADSYSVEVSVNNIEPDVRVIADLARINQLMANLLSNAIKFSNAGGQVQVSLSTESGRAVMAIKDNGRGIPQKEKTRIFERFHQVDSSDRRERGGTGLGLSVVKEITDAHQAEITVQSQLGEGTTFYISFSIANSC